MTTNNLLWNQAAEAAVLGVLLRGEASLDEIRSALSPEDFYSPHDRAIYATVVELAKRGVGVDLVTIYDALRSSPETRAVDASDLARLCDAAPVPSHLSHYVNIVKRDANRRKYLQAAERLAVSLSRSQPNGTGDAVEQCIQELTRIHQEERPDKPNWLTAAELVNAEHTSVEWLWEGYLAPGLLTLLSARPKIGKTTLIFHFLSMLFRHQPFLDHATHQAGKVLLFTEESPILLKRRLERLELGGEDLLIVQRFTVSGWPDVLARIRLGAQHGVRLVIVDTLAAFWGVDDENDAPKAVNALLPLQILAQQLGIAVLLIHHLRKSPGEDGTAHRGSGAIVGAVDVAVEMSRDSQKATRRRLTTLSRFDETPPQVVIELDGGVYQSKGSPEAVSRAEVNGRVLESLPGPDEEPIERDALLEQLDPKPSVSQLKEVLKALAEDERLVERLGGGKKGDPYRYRLTGNSDSATYRPLSVAESNSRPSPESPLPPPQSYGPAGEEAIRLIREAFPGTEAHVSDHS